MSHQKLVQGALGNRCKVVSVLAQEISVNLEACKQANCHGFLVHMCVNTDFFVFILACYCRVLWH